MLLELPNIVDSVVRLLTVYCLHATQVSPRPDISWHQVPEQRHGHRDNWFVVNGYGRIRKKILFCLNRRALYARINTSFGRRCLGMGCQQGSWMMRLFYSCCSHYLNCHVLKPKFRLDMTLTQKNVFPTGRT